MIVIGEKLNATRKSVERAVAERDAAAVAALVEAQDRAGAEVIDVNAGSGGGDAAKAAGDMIWLVGVAQNATEKPLSIDSENPEVLAAGLSAAKGASPWINSVSAESRRLEKVLPLSAACGSPLVALCMGDDGIPRDLTARMKAATKIYEAAAAAGIAPERLYFDPLVMPLGAEPGAGLAVLECLRAVKAGLPGAKTIMGASNVSFGLPRRPLLNRALLVLALSAGLDAAILDPTDEALMMEILAAEALLGRDPHCARFLRAHRKRTKKGEKA